MDKSLLVAALDAVALKRVAVIVCSVAFFLRFVTGGWYILAGFVPYILICLAHYGVHSYAASRSSPITHSLIWLFLLSNIFLLAAFLFQYDEGDGPGWLTITAFLDWRFSGTVLSEYGLFYNGLLFTPVLATWILLMLRTRKISAS
jgi:hypothetical protein